MGSKKKASRVFGRSSGKNKLARQSKCTGRPNYVLRRKKSEKLRIKILNVRKLRQTVKVQGIKQTTFKSYLVENGDKLKLKIKKIQVSDPQPQGYRLMNLGCLQAHVSEITMHAALCPQAIEMASKGETPISLQSEVRAMGLASVICIQCKGCKSTFKLQNSPNLPGSKRYDINVRAVWGSMATGNGPSHLNELMGTMDAPGLSPSSFSAIEEQIGNWWRGVLQENMLEAGAEERRIAIEKGSFHQEVPAVTVITDGGWSKRTHKHSYNALGGVAIIIGKETKKLLHIGIRNKYCYICNTASNKKTDPRPHTCYKNWTKDSQSMESDIILEGFKEAESRHGLRYMRVIGDGDSSVYARIREEAPVWGRDVVKEECANHMAKCYRSNLEKLISDNPLYKGKNNLSKTTRVRLVSAVRSAVRLRSSEVTGKTLSRDNAIKLLRHDILNSVYHVFGQHSKCTNFCKAKETNASTGKSSAQNTDSTQENATSDVFEEQTELWTEGASVEAQEEARLGTHIKFCDVEQFIIQDVTRLLSRIAEKADRLIGNATTNLAENWMHIRSKFDGGKIYNLCNRGSWHGRCYGGALRMNVGPEWSPVVWQSVTGTEPGTYFNQLYRRRKRALDVATRHQSKAETRRKRWIRKCSSLKVNSTRQARTSYGPQAIDVTSDVSKAELQSLQNSYFETHVNISSQQIQNIKFSTSEQSLSGIWHSERKKRLTASNFGPVVRRNPSLPVKNLVRNLLYSKFKGNRHTRNGLLQERSTIEEYKLRKAEENENVTVESCGLIINESNPYLAASPDGLVSTGSGDKGLIEVKNLLHSKPLNLFQAAKNSNFCLQNINGSLSLKKSHNYFYQCHGLLNVCEMDWIDFVVRTQNPYQMHIERIKRDTVLWNTEMLPKLKAFYFSCILPELACPREGKSPSIREPGVWYVPPVVKKVTRKGKSLVPRKRKKGEETSSSESDTEPVPTVSRTSTRRRCPSVKFCGRRIKHEWIINERSGTTEWYSGSVLSILSGKDGELGTVYEILYDGDDEPYEVRLQWSLRALSSKDSFHNVVFVDETTVEMCSSGRLFFYNPSFGIEKLPSRQPKPKHSYKVHVWGGISYRGRTDLCIFTGIMDSIIYQKILEKNFLPFVQHVFPDGYRLYQDNDSKHKSRSTQQWMQDVGMLPNVMETPASSPDLNPIENVWASMKYFLQSTVKPKTKDELVNGIKSFWCTLTSEKCTRYIDHIHKVIPYVVLNSGAPSGF